MMELDIKGSKGITINDDDTETFHDAELEKEIKEKNLNNKNKK